MDLAALAAELTAGHPDTGAYDADNALAAAEINAVNRPADVTDYFDLHAQGDLPVDLTDSNFKVYLAGAESAGCMSASQETALLALGNNLKSRQPITPGNKSWQLQIQKRCDSATRMFAH